MKATHALGAAPEVRDDSARTATRGRPQLTLRYVMALAFVLPLILVPALAWISYQNALRDSQQQAETAAAMAAEHVSRLVQANTILTRQLQARMAAVAPASPGSAQQLHKELVALAQGLPHVNSLWVIGADGYPVVSSLFDPVPRINYADREYFKFHHSAVGQVFVSRLLRTRSANELFFDISARWAGPTGQFLGVINVTMRPEYVTDFFRRLTEFNPALQVTLLRTDGYVLARAPEPAEVGDRIAPDGPITRALTQAMQSPDTVLKRFDAAPLAVAVTVDRRLAAQAWRQDVAATGVLLLVGVVMLILILGLALHWADRELKAVRLLAAETQARLELEASLRHAQRLDALGTLTGGVAHDFNNLLGVVNNALHLLAARQPGFASSAVHAQIERAVASGKALTGKLLSFSRSQAVTTERVALGQSLPQIAELMQLALGRDAKLTLELEDGLPAIEVDRSELELALLNIASNARGAGASQLRLSARACSREMLDAPSATGGDGLRFVEIAVHDNGDGMPAEVVRRAFEPFFTTKPRGSGTGLGLSQVYGLCVQAKGAAWITSLSGKGTTIHLAFPVAPVKSDTPVGSNGA